MILFIVRLLNSPVTFMVKELSQTLTEYFPGIEIKIIEPEYIHSTLDRSYTDLKNKVEILKNSKAPLDPEVREELLKIFKAVFLEPYDLLIIEGLVRSEDDVRIWKDFFSTKKDLVFVLEIGMQNMGPPENSSEEFKNLRSMCINAGSTYYGDDMDGISRFFKKRLSPDLKHLIPA